jgi:hypothetical protein
MELIAGDSKLVFDKNKQTVIFDGSMRLANLTEYEKISTFLNEVVKVSDSILILDLKNLNFLNSSGITTLSMFILSLKKSHKVKLRVLGSNSISWQEKSLPNFNKLWTDVEISIE